MENQFNSMNDGGGSGGRGHNGNCTTVAYDIWSGGGYGAASNIGSRLDWSHYHPTSSFSQENATSMSSSAGGVDGATNESFAVHALMGSITQPHLHHHHHHHPSLYAGGGTHYLPDPHLVCLNLGKRHYFEDAGANNPLLMSHRHHLPSLSLSKRGKPCFAAAGGGNFLGRSSAVVSMATVPRCQVEGCHVTLVNAKDYHRRHKVCEMHSKAPKVVVHGQEQRFCQQCSRFHGVSEFDDAKRSCRRRLAGHNERRRKSSHDHHHHHHSSAAARTHPSQAGHALSLLSSTRESWVSSSSDLSSRCSAALHELIAENRAAVLAKQLIMDRDVWNHSQMFDSLSSDNQNCVVPQQQQQQQHQTFPGSSSHVWDRFSGDSHVTLDLMQAPTSAFGFLAVRGKPKEEEEEEECSSELWSPIGGAHVV